MRVANPHAGYTPASASATMLARIKGLAPTRHDLTDAGFLVVLLALAFVTFFTTFDSWRFALVAGIGVLLGVLIGHLSVVWRWPWGLAVVACGALYFLLGGPLAAWFDTWNGLPTPASLQTLGLLLVSGWKGMLTTLPPIAADGVYVALLLLIALLSGALGQIIARRSSKTSTALIVPGLALAASIALGTMDAPLAAWTGLAFMAVGFGWLANRYPRRRRLIGGSRPRPMQVALGAGTLAVALTAGLLVGPMLPGTTASPRAIARTYVAPPIDMRDYVSPLVGFRKYSSQQLNLFNKKELVRTSGLAEGSWLRFAVLDSYNGHVWSATGDENDTSSGFLRLGAKVPNGPEGAPSVQVTIMGAYASNTDLNPWVPGTGRMATIGFTGPAAREHAETLRFDLATNQALLPDRLKGGDVLDLTTESLRLFTELPDDTQPGKGRRVPDAASDFLAALGQTLSSDQQAPFKRLRQSADKLRSAGSWSDGTANGEGHYLPGHGEYRLQQFMEATEYVGSDEQYAAVFALIANRYGFPARVVFGAQVPADGVVLGSHVKAWVEIQINDGEWITVPTDTFTPDRNKHPNESPKQADVQSAATVVPPPNPARPPGSYDEMLETDPASSKITSPKQPSVLTEYAEWIAWVGIPVGVIVLLLGSIVAAKAIRRQRRRTQGEQWKRVAAGWREVLDQARDIGFAVQQSATRLEQAAALGGGQLDALAESTNAAVFGGGHVTDAQVQDHWTEVRHARTGLLGGVGWWRRFVARFSVRSLLPTGKGGVNKIR